MTCYSCQHYRRKQEGPTAWSHACNVDALRKKDCPNVKSRLCEAFVYLPGSDEREDDHNEKTDN